jgi:O-antigen ligase
MTDSAMRAPAAFDRPALARIADALAAATAASLPWSTTATGILAAAWLVTLLPTLDVPAVRREIVTAAGGSPLILVGLLVLGMLWADVSPGERVWGIEGYVKLLCIPLLLAQFRRSPNGAWVIISFFSASLALMLLSWFLALMPSLPWRGKLVGIPVKDYIVQSEVFTLCAFAALGYATDAWRGGQRQVALVLICIAAGFFGNIGYVETGRTTLAIIGVLVPLFGFRKFGWKGMMAASLVGGVLAGVVWTTSPYLRYRVTHIAEEVARYQSENEPTSTGARLDFWRNSVESVAKAPILGHGTGSIPYQLRSTISSDTGIASIATVNPHNEVFVVAVQLGLVGTMALLAMWISHLLLFRGEAPIAWFGLAAVTGNMVGCLANSHLTDFTSGWIYVFAVGVLGGMVLRQDTQLAAGGSPAGARSAARAGGA